ncbi:CHAT domain-containing protein [Sphaerisporangium rhizosphaerae]|uniref:CHAT domain-containing protein n=1 Tax=Sphaerisporangium rhizosphaerae TaxID=2269375 RepID=A0ABW2PEY9_9ACTN
MTPDPLTTTAPLSRPSTEPPEHRHLVAAAERAVEGSGADPERARRDALAVLDRARAWGCREAESIAHRALGLAARELGDLRPAADHLDQAVRVARDLPGRAAQARMSLVAVRTELGDPVGALRVADLAEGGLGGLDAARLGVQRSVALVRLGRPGEAVAHCDRAVERLTGAGDPRFLAGALLNRGLAHTFLEDYDAASRDLSACAALARDAGLDHIATLAEANVPFVAARRGDVQAAFTGYEAAERALTGYPERLAAMRADFAGALLAAYLPGEARALLRQAVPDLAATGALVALAESRLLLAQVELLVGDPYQARAAAEAAARELDGQGRDAWVPLAEEVILRSRIAVERPSPRLAEQARSLAARLAAHGWPAPAAALRLTAAELTTAGPTDAGGSVPDVVEGDLEFVINGAPAAGRAHRVVRHHAVALRHSLRGDPPAAFSALREGLREAAAGSERLSDPGVRAHAVRAGERLAGFGLSLALRDGRPDTVLGWAEHCRAVARGHAGEAMPIDHLRAALGGAALVQLVRHDDLLAAVVVTAEHRVLRSLGSYTEAAEATIRLRYGLRRAGLRDTGSGPPGVAVEAGALAARLVDPLAADIADRPLVIVPTGALHTLPWATLPPLHGRALCVAASAGAWLTATSRHPDPPSGVRPSPAPVPPSDGVAGPVVVGAPLVAAVAGPGLEHAGTEAARVVRAYQEAARTATTRRPPGDPAATAVRVAATTAGVLAALGRAEVVHIAAHGFFSARSPLLSRIALDDGALMAYDLLGLRRTPWLVVLSACDAGMAHAPVDGTALGLAGAFLDQGSACVIAGLVPVRDEEALTLMTLLHKLLVRGHAPAEALAIASERTGVHGFACFGSLGHPLRSHDR